MRRSLSHYRAINVAVVLGAAVATAALTGSLVVGDSVRGSLRGLTLDRLGATDDVLSSDRLFREDLGDTDAFAAAYSAVAPAILLNGAARAAADGRRASGVQIVGADERFAGLYESGADLTSALKSHDGPRLPSVVVNDALRQELSAEIGDELLLSFTRRPDVHSGSLFGSRDASAERGQMRAVISGALPDRGIGRFSLRPHQHAPMNAYVALPDLQRALGKPGGVNLLLATREATTRDATGLAAAAARALAVEDLGLSIREYDDVVIVESERLVLSDGLVAAIVAAAADAHMTPTPVLSYVATRMQVGTREAAYAIVAGLDDRPTGSRSQGVPTPGPGEILLTEWVANDLAAVAGDSLTMEYFVVAPDETLLPREATFQVVGVGPAVGILGDRRLTPTIPGLGDADDIGDWDAPFPVDMRRVTGRDEDYWDAHGPTPKAFVPLSDGQRLWASRFGSVTSVWLSPQGDMGTAAAFRRALLDHARPSDAGFAAHAVKDDGLAAAKGATDFSGLFVGFSTFLIAAAAMLTQMLFRLSVEQRAREVGTLLAVGFPARLVRRRFLREGAVLAVVGASAGVGVGVGYAWLMIAGLRTLWVGAIGTRHLSLHIGAGSLGLGWLISVVIVVAAIALTTRRLGRLPVRALLSGSGDPDHVARPRIARVVAPVATCLALVTLALGVVTGVGRSPSLFFGSGALALVGGLAWFSVWLRRPSKKRARLRTAMDIAARGPARRPSRSMLSATLIACACFVIVAVGLNRHAPPSPEEAGDRQSGTGGFALVAETDLPVRHDLNSAEGRFELGLSAGAEGPLANSDVTGFRTVPGEDASCLNLYRPAIPTLIGATDGFIARNAFTFADAVEDRDNAWELLHRDLGPGVAPMIADANSAQWILHVTLGGDLVTIDEHGSELRLRLVATLSTSVLQSVAVISDEALRAHFPTRSGASFFLIDSPPDLADGLSATLERDLAAYGFDATSSASKLASFRAVEDTYLSTFQALGGLGLLLGTVGLAVVLLRNIIERRGELATMRAFGFRRATLARMLIVENAFLAAVGLAVGTGATAVAVLPALTAAGAHVPWLSVAATLAGVFACALLTSAIAAAYGLRAPLLESLKAD